MARKAVVNPIPRVKVSRFSVVYGHGQPTGPCVKMDDICEHDDCHAMMEIAATPCAICGRPIGFDRGFFDLSLAFEGREPELVHVVCGEW